MAAFAMTSRSRFVAVNEKPLCYRIDGEPYEGVLLEALASPAARPVVLYHEYTGIDGNILAKGRDLAKRGHTILVADLYGSGARRMDHETALPHYRRLKNNRRLLRQRAVAAAEALADNRGCDIADLSLLGFSLGGAAALEAAGAPLPVRLAISVYGYLDTPDPARHERYLSRLLVFHGLQDRIVPIQDLTDFLKKMTAAGTRLEAVLISEAGHGFCNPDVEEDRERGNFYNEATHHRVWREVTSVLKKEGSRQ
jgi:dienelactone hydrolase